MGFVVEDGRLFLNSNLSVNGYMNKTLFVEGYNLDEVLEISKPIYHILAGYQPWDIPRKIEFKTLNPGEQSTSTFHRTILENQSQYFQGKFYREM